MEIKQKILINVPLLLIEVIDDLIEKEKYKDRTNFIIKAIKDKLKVEGIDLTPNVKIKLEEWW